MARYLIELRYPGAPDDPAVPWGEVATAESESAAAAVAEYCQLMNWPVVRYANHVATVPGVGIFRAIPGESAALRSFIVERQDPMGSNDLTVTWSKVDTIDASDIAAAVMFYCERMQWESVSVQGAYFMPYGLGSFRVVPAPNDDTARD